jgi:hypothetical protein
VGGKKREVEVKLKDFVTETLKEIFDGVVDAQEYCSRTGSGGEVASGTRYKTRDGTAAQSIEFDVAVTTTEGTETKGGIGVFVGPVGLGSQGKSDASNTSVSRIKFSVPVVFPHKSQSPTR